MKKTFIGVIALGASSLAFANGGSPTAPIATNYFDGTYVGIGVGVNHVTGNDQSTSIAEFSGIQTVPNRIVSKIPLMQTTTSLDNEIGKTMIAGALFAGYGKTFHPEDSSISYYLGGELFGRYNPTNIKSSGISDISVYDDSGKLHLDQHTDYTNKLENDYSLGTIIRGGVLVTPKTMIYVLAGVDYARFKIDTDASNNITDIQLHYRDTYNFSKNKLGFIPGIGIETMLTNQLSLRAQYTYTYYGSITGSCTSPTHIKTFGRYTTEGVSATTKHNYNFKNIDRGLFTVDLTYHFNGIA